MTAHLPGRGYAPSYSPPFGAQRRDEDDAESESNGTRWTPSFASSRGSPSTLWGELIKAGYYTVKADTYDGIPYIFGEREMWTVRGVVAGHNNAADITLSYALVRPEGASTSQECNREEGLAAGRALDAVFGRQQLADEALGAALFRRPTRRATLASPVTDPTTDTFRVLESLDDQDWPEEGHFFIGRECVRFASRTDGAFTGCTRGVAGMPHYHTASASSAYRQCTDVPVYWRGRLMTRWEHLVAPDGRFLGERWCELGEWCRQEWRGFVRDTPRPDAMGMVLACLPIQRIAAQEFGAEVKGVLARSALGGLNLPYIVSEPSDTIAAFHPAVEWVEAPTEPLTTNNGIFDVHTWAAIVANHLAAEFGEISARVHYNGIELRFAEPVSDEFTGWVFEGRAWFLEDGPATITRVNAATDPGLYSAFIRFSWNNGAATNGSWVVARLEPSIDFEDAEIGASGFLAIDADGQTEVVAYDAKRTSSDGTLTAFRISARGVMGTMVAPWSSDASVRVIAGAVGSWEVCLRTILTSSGMAGARGSYDKLAHGFGLGLPEDWIVNGLGTVSFSSPTEVEFLGMVPTDPVVAATSGKSSVKDLLCGWLALNRACLVQRRHYDGSIRLDVVSTDVVDDTDAEDLDTDDVMLDGHESPETIEAPNHVRMIGSDLLTERPLQVVRDSQRAQAEGVHSIEIKAPGVTAAQALKYGAELILLSDGQAALRNYLPPWVEVQVGDSRRNITAHPVIWDWDNGVFAPASVMTRLLGLEREPWSQLQIATWLLAGQSQERCFLCPCALVIQQDGAYHRVAKGDIKGFVDGDEVLCYQMGDEDATETVAAINSITEGEDYDTIELDVSLVGGEWVITFNEYTTGTARQQRHMFVRSDKAWR